MPTALIEPLPPQIYAGMTFKLNITFPANYPYVAPTLRFESSCYHPNVDINNGAICLDILQVRWASLPQVVLFFSITG